jgi:hypothetical protein
VVRDVDPIAALAANLPATRQLHEGYWLGAMIRPRDVALLRQLGIRVVLSAVRPSDETVKLLQIAGIEEIAIPLGSHFAHSERILEVVRRHPPHQIFIHCRHGADRTGAIAAFLLVVRHGWSVPDAFYAVLYASQPDVDGLVDVLGRFGYDDARAVDDPSVGFYSVAAAGGVGGLKARNRRYARLIETTLETMFRYRDDLVPPEQTPDLARVGGGVDAID